MINYYDRELSWLSFNHRVLQEAQDPSVPLYERIKFLAIWSSNLDEFFRVRVASLRSLINLKKKKLKFDPAELLKEIHNRVNKQQKEFGKIFREEIIHELKKNGIYLLKEDEINTSQKNYVEQLFGTEILPNLNVTLLTGSRISLFLKNNSIYLAVRLQPVTGKNGNNRASQKIKVSRYALVEVPSDKLTRFVQLPRENGNSYIMFLDDVIRHNLPKIFPGYNIVEAYAVKLTRDAELYIDDEFSGNLLEKIKSSISKRKTGVPCRFLYDETMPKDFLKYLRTNLSLSREDIIPGGRYHNYFDLFSFPNPEEDKHLYESMPPLQSIEFKNKNVFDAVSSSDIMLYYPYHSFQHVIDFVNEAAKDENVLSIKITLYRTAKDSKIIKALINAAKNGKAVTAFIEVKARFDEELNFQNAGDLEKAGVKVLYSFPGLKVHSKICLVCRKESEQKKYYAYLATGNFNEKTARIYSDAGLFTCDETITSELRKVFSYLSRKTTSNGFEVLGTAPFNLRKKITQLIENETANAAQGKKAQIILKLNSLEDKKVIKKLYSAADKGVKIKINVRGICCMKPDNKRNVSIRSIVDRYLEHARIYYFYNGGDEKLFISSADFMRRNFDHRIELLIPILNMSLLKELKKVLGMYFKDNMKARKINCRQNNPFIRNRSKDFRVQYEIYNYLKEEAESKTNVPVSEHNRV